MTDATTVDDIVVVGQRRRPGGAFPSRNSPGGGVGDDGGAQQDEFADREGELAQSSPDPCADPATALVWNLDAAAAAAARNLISTANSSGSGSSLSNREFGTNLYRGPGGALTHTTPIDVGDPSVGGQIPSVDIGWHQATPETWMGDMHNHPSGQGQLSDGEWAHFINRVSQYSAEFPDRRAELDALTVYVVVADSASPQGYRIHAYTRNTPYNALGHEVNPNAQPCPAP